MEAGLIRVQNELLSGTDLVILSDNATCYKIRKLSIIILFVARENGFALRKFIHTETQDGKSLIDAHFAIDMRHRSRVVAKGKDFTTTASLFTALTGVSGLRNSAAELLRIDHGH